MTKFGFSLLTGVCGVFAGVLLCGGVKDWGKTLAMGGLTIIPSVYLTHLLVDTQATNKVRSVQNKLTDTSVALERSQSQLTNIERANGLLAIDLEKVRHLLQTCDKSRTQSESVVSRLTPQIDQLQQELSSCRQKTHDLEAEVLSWEENFHTYVETEAQKQFKASRANEIQKIFDEHDSITSEAMQLFRELQAWGQKIAHGHTAKREIITNLAGAYNQNLDELGDSLEKERSYYLEQIELLHEKVGRLQHALDGDLLEPQYLDVGYSVPGNIAKSIVEIVWRDLTIPLSMKGFYEDSKGSTDVGLGYSSSASVPTVIETLKRYSEVICKRLNIYKITSIRKHDISDLIILTFRREAPIKDEQIKDLVSSADEFINYIVSHPIRYRLIADPGEGKTPSTAVMVSELLKVGGTRGNTAKGAKIPNTLVNVSCPDVVSSQKDGDSYPLMPFLKYGDSTAAVKSFDDAFDEWEHRKANTKYADNYFTIWVWDELDNTINLADNPKDLGETFKIFLKQAHHTGMGWIVSGQSLMTSQIPGFRNDDRTLFTEIIIGVRKIRTYLETYGSKVLNKAVVAQLQRNLEVIEIYQEDKNNSITDEAKKYRLALVLDEKSPKLFWLPNLDSAGFDVDQINQTNEQARLVRLGKPLPDDTKILVGNSQDADSVRLAKNQTKTTTIGKAELVADLPDAPKPHCPHCSSDQLKDIEKGSRYRCLSDSCGKRFVPKKAVWK